MSIGRCLTYHAGMSSLRQWYTVKIQQEHMRRHGTKVPQLRDRTHELTRKGTRHERNRSIARAVEAARKFTLKRGYVCPVRTCSCCRKTEHDPVDGMMRRYWDVDHIDGNPLNDDPSNLQDLCVNCHAHKTATDAAPKAHGR